MDELIRTLEKTVSTLQSDQNEAVRFIEDFIKRDFTGFLKALSDILYNTQNSPVVRTAAGLQLKNQLTSRDEATRLRQQEVWIRIPEDTRQYIKQRVLGTLGTEQYRPSSAPQCAAYIALAELPENNLSTFIRVLTSNVSNPNSTPNLRLASLEAIGYICQDIDQSCLQQNDSDSILTAIVGIGMRDCEPNEVKLAATTALLNSLEFTEKNFCKQDERLHIMRAVYNAAQYPDPQISVVALQCLVKIMSLYYQHMDEPTVGALYNITTKAMQSENDDIALQGIEFWSNVCDEEIQLANELEEAQELGQQPERISKGYAKQALPTLAPILVELLTRQDETDESNDDWNPCKSAGVCLMLLASCCGNAVVAHVLPFINQNINSEDWRRRDAAIMTFGSILDGPDQATVQPISIQIVPHLIRFMNDASIVVRDSAAWTIGKLCDTVPEAVLTSPPLLMSLVQALIANLGNEPRVATNVCWAINSLVTAAGQSAKEMLTSTSDGYYESFLLSEFYVNIIPGLLSTTERQIAVRDQEQYFRSAAYEALMAVIKAAPKDCYKFVYPSTFEVVLRRIATLNETIARPDVTAPEVRAQLHDFLSLLWITLASCIRRMEREDARNQSDLIMQQLLTTLNYTYDTGATQEDVLMAASALLDQVGSFFSRYMPIFKSYLINALSNSAVPQLNLTAIGLISDLSRNLSMDLYDHCDEFMQALLVKLKEENYDRNAKAQILTVFGDFAIAFGSKFAPYIPTCLEMLHHATQIQQPDRNDYDLIDYCLKLRECTLEGYTGIIHGLKDKKGQQIDVSILLPRIAAILKFLEQLCQDPDLTDGLLSSSCGLVGDILEAFGSNVISLVTTPGITNLLSKGVASKYDKTRELAGWTQKLIKKTTKKT